MSLVERADDWLNPIAVKELRQAVRGKFVMVAVILSLLGQLIAVAVIAVARSLGPMSSSGSDSFVALFSIVFTAAVFLVPAYTGFRMASERADHNVDLLFLTTIRPWTIVIGKVWSAAALVVLLFSASLPFLVFAYVLRGVDFVSIAVLLVIAVVVVISQAIVALFLGSLPTSRPFKILLALGFLFGALMTVAPLLAATSQIMRMGMGVMLAAPTFWVAFVSFATVVAVIDGVLLVLTTAIITPAAANRALPIRIMVLAGGAVAFAPAFLVYLTNNTFDLVQMWAIALVFMATLVLLSATSEREAWGPRVARTIPRNPVLRAIAFLFYSGSAGGTLLAALLYAGTIALYYACAVSVPLAPRAAKVGMTQYLIDGALAMLAYAMTAVLLRRKVLKRVPAARTWGIVLAIFFALTVLPPLALLTADAERADWGSRVHVTTIANPFPTPQRPREARDQRSVFLAVWAILATAANGGWFIAQMRAFRRLDPPTEAAPPELVPLRELTSE